MSDVVAKCDNEKITKVKVASAEIIVSGKADKPYYEIKYYDLSKNEWCIGYGSYELKFVFQWLNECFELAKEPQEQPTVNTWIPCSERLPKNQTELWWCTTEYLTCSKNGTIEVLCYCDGWNCSFLNADMDVWRDNEIKDVIAWMPLPEPYNNK